MTPQPGSSALRRAARARPRLHSFPASSTPRAACTSTRAPLHSRPRPQWTPCASTGGCWPTTGRRAPPRFRGRISCRCSRPGRWRCGRTHRCSTARSWIPRSRRSPRTRSASRASPRDPRAAPRTPWCPGAWGWRSSPRTRMRR